MANSKKILDKPKQIMKSSRVVRLNAKISPDLIFSKIEKGDEAITLFGFKAPLRTSSLMFFKESGYKCVKCGIVGSRFYLEKDKDTKNFKLHLYGLDRYGSEVEMTKDHIIPMSKGGPNKHFNIQPMCMRCNSSKSNTLDLHSLFLFTIRFFKFLKREVSRHSKFYLNCLKKIFKEYLKDKASAFYYYLDQNS